MQMADSDQSAMREAIEQLELRIEELSLSVEKSRKAILASKISMAGGALLTLALLSGLITAQPLAIVVAIAAVCGGIVGFGANVSTARQDSEAMQAAAAQRAELIGRLKLREIGQGTNLSFYQ